ncbi:MAG: type II toxin-antitoxin system HicA family toxin [SAR202 cluster bacterium]|nr:type II toxin-antitoxin system HicA family toxin [SAR202 cluster bacterium]
MPAFGPISHAGLLGCLRQAGFHGPYTGGGRQYMVREQVKLAVPNPHQGDIFRDLLARILRQAGISRNEWESL